ncbi:MAG: hypothetical protein WD342_04380 [Verrucomicrobiales bacterium]
MSLLDPTLHGFFWVLVVAMGVILADVFLETEILSNLALLAISMYAGLLFGASPLTSILIGVVTLVVLIALFYAVWKRVAAPAIRRCLPAGSDEAIHSAKGATGEYRLIDGKSFVQWNGDLWPVDLEAEELPNFSDRAPVRIESAEGGVFSISPLSQTPPASS